GFKHRKRVFLSDGANPSACLGNSDAEGALSEARAHEEGSSVPRCGLSKKGAGAGFISWRHEMIRDGETIFPYPCALADFQIVLLVCLRPWRPVSWPRPIVRAERKLARLSGCILFRSAVNLDSECDRRYRGFVRACLPDSRTHSQSQMPPTRANPGGGS